MVDATPCGRTAARVNSRDNARIPDRSIVVLAP